MGQAYRRILLKLSGEALAGKRQFGIDPAVAEYTAGEIAAVHAQGVQIACVIGGGNIFRGSSGDFGNLERPTADAIGMMATLFNSLILRDYLLRRSIGCRVFSAFSIPKVAPLFVRDQVIEELEKGTVVIVAGGTSNPFFTTDTAAALRSAELAADVLLKATKVDGIYTADPVTTPDAKKLDTCTFAEALRQNLRIMDAAAFSLCMENSIPVIVFRLMDQGALGKCIAGEHVGSKIYKGE